jgi:two-component system, NtrC family, sensor histidine kinase HupT/HoxJ
MTSRPSKPPRISPAATPASSPLEGVDESAWLDVIHKMDEVYSQLVADEVALEEKNVELEQSQQFIFSLLSAMSDVLVACDERGKIEETNAALCELVGQGDAALRGTSVYALLADDTGRERIRGVIEQASTRAGAVVEIDLRDAQGHPVPVDLNCTPRLSSTGRRVGHVFVGRPMGEIKRAYHQLREAHEALKRTQQQLLHSEKMASLGRLVAGVAHELNNPISFVLGNVHALERYSGRLQAYVDALHARPPAPDANAARELAELRATLRIDHLLRDLPSLIEGTLEGAQRTADIVKGLKRFSAVDREERTQVDLNGVIERAIHWVRKGTAPAFDVHWSPGPPMVVTASGGQLLQVVMNLIQNAYDAASSVKGAVPAMWITAQTGGAVVTLRFRDNGPGILAAHLSRIFDPFFTTKPVGKGTGLGLSISYGIVDQHGGRLSASNSKQGGAEFVLELPLA